MEYTAMVFRRNKEVRKILQPNEDLPVAKGRGLEQREPKGVKGRPEKENENNDQLWGNQRVRKPSVLKDAPFHDELGRATSPSPLLLRPRNSLSR